MPIYDYACDACGPFTALRPMALFRDPCACPECGGGAARIVVSAPALIGGSTSGRVAFAATEPSASAARPGPAAHPAGCGCCVRRVPLPGALSAGGRVFTAHGPGRRSNP